MRAHEGSRPDPADAAAYAEWLRVRHARWSREAGEPLDPRHALLMGLQ